MGYKILALGTQVPGTSYVMSVVEQQDGQTTEKNEQTAAKNSYSSVGNGGIFLQYMSVEHTYIFVTMK